MVSKLYFRSQGGFTSLLFLLILAVGAGVIVSVGLGFYKTSGTIETTKEDTASTSPTQTLTVTPVSESNSIPVPTVQLETNLPPFKEIAISGFAYEDRTGDGVFNSDDPALANMQFYLYDSYDPNVQISTLYSDSQGKFSISIKVRGKLVIKPTTYNNFRPKDEQREVSKSATDMKFAFRSVSAPVVNQVGIIEGDIFQDGNRNGRRDSWEGSVYFLKLYLVDEYGNYYNTVRDEQTTDPGGHFKYLNLLVPRKYMIKLSNPTGEYDIGQPETEVILTSSRTEDTNVQIPVYRY